MFRLYPVEQPPLSFADYAAILKEATGKKSALEFGPGCTTLALIEAEVERIVSLESDPEWLEKKRGEFTQYPQVTIARYRDEVPVAVADIAFQQFDIAMVDAPAGFTHEIPGRKPRVKHRGMEDCSRLNTCLFALERAPIVLLHDAKRPLERGTLGRLNAMGYKFEYIPETRLARITRHGNVSATASLQGVAPSRGDSAWADA